MSLKSSRFFLVESFDSSCCSAFEVAVEEAVGLCTVPYEAMMLQLEGKYVIMLLKKASLCSRVLETRSKKLAHPLLGR